MFQFFELFPYLSTDKKKPHVLVNAQQDFIEENTIDKSLVDRVSIEAKMAPRGNMKHIRVPMLHKSMLHNRMLHNIMLHTLCAYFPDSVNVFCGPLLLWTFCAYHFKPIPDISLFQYSTQEYVA